MSTAEIIAELPRLSPAELGQVRAKLAELVEPSRGGDRPDSVADHPALGMWKDRADLPDDSVEASNVLRSRMMSRTEAGADAAQS